MSSSDLERRVSDVGDELASTFSTLLSGLAGAPHSPQRLADLLEQKIVMTSRLLRAVRCEEPMAVVHQIPGPAPLRRLVDAARKKSAGAAAATAAAHAVDVFEELIRDEAGDRSSLDAIISAWLPEAREEFEMRRKQSAYKAMSELRGSSCNVHFSSIVLSPGDGKLVDVVNVQGMVGLHRMRPGATARFATRRMAGDASDRRPLNLKGQPIDGLDMVRLDQFCANKPAPIEAQRCGATINYTLGGTGFGPKSRSDVMLAEVNRNEPLATAEGSRPFFFHSVDTPARKILFDLIVHKDLYKDEDPELILFDTTVSGPASVNDPERVIDRLPMHDEVDVRGRGLSRLRTADLPMHVELFQHVCSELGWDGNDFRIYRYKSDYPVIGTQVCMAFDPK